MPPPPPSQEQLNERVRQLELQHAADQSMIGRQSTEVAALRSQVAMYAAPEAPFQPQPAAALPPPPLNGLPPVPPASPVPFTQPPAAQFGQPVAPPVQPPPDPLTTVTAREQDTLNQVWAAMSPQERAQSLAAQPGNSQDEKVSAFQRGMLQTLRTDFVTPPEKLFGGTPDQPAQPTVDQAAKTQFASLIARTIKQQDQTAHGLPVPRGPQPIMTGGGLAYHQTQLSLQDDGGAGGEPTPSDGGIIHMIGQPAVAGVPTG